MSWLNFNNLSIGRILEFEGPFMSVYDFFPQATPELLQPHRCWLEPGAIQPNTDMLLMPIQSYVLRTDGLTILVDSCIGNHKTVPWFPKWNKKTDNVYFYNMKRMGVHPDEIDYVFCTHLHVDHTGWNTRLLDGRWVPTFKNAKYILSKLEVEHAKFSYEKFKDQTYVENVLPLLEAKQAVLVDENYQLTDKIYLEHSPGHTPGHCTLHFNAKSHHGLLTGDMIHSPIQCQYPDWNFKFDVDKNLAAKTRRTFLEKHADTDSMIFTAHFPLPSAGKIIKKGEAFKFEYIEWTY